MGAWGWARTLRPKPAVWARRHKKVQTWEFNLFSVIYTQSGPPLVCRFNPQLNWFNGLETAERGGKREEKSGWYFHGYFQEGWITSKWREMKKPHFLPQKHEKLISVYKVCMEKVLSITLATPWTVACQAPLFMELSRQEYWSVLPFSLPGDLPNPGIEPRCPELQADSLPTELSDKSKNIEQGLLIL